MVSETPRMLRIVINRKKDRIQSMNTKLTVMIIVWYAGLGFGLYRAQKAGIFESLLTKIKSYIFWPRSRVGARSFWLLCLVEVYHLLRKINFWFYSFFCMSIWVFPNYNCIVDGIKSMEGNQIIIITCPCQIFNFVGSIIDGSPVQKVRSKMLINRFSVHRISKLTIF